MMHFSINDVADQFDITFEKGNNCSIEAHSSLDYLLAFTIEAVNHTKIIEV